LNKEHQRSALSGLQLLLYTFTRLPPCHVNP